MTTIDHYRRCFEACGVTLPSDGECGEFRFANELGGVETTVVESDLDGYLSPFLAECVCR